MIEGPGHVPMHKIKINMDKQLKECGAYVRPADDRHRAATTTSPQASVRP